MDTESLQNLMKRSDGGSGIGREHGSEGSFACLFGTILMKCMKSVPSLLINVKRSSINKKHF